MEYEIFLAKNLYSVYREAVGKKSNTGEQLPTADEFFEKAKNDVQIKGWLAVAERVKFRFPLPFTHT